MKSIVDNYPYYFIGFPLGGAYYRKLVERVENIPVPCKAKVPKKMISLEKYRDEEHWYIVDVNTLKRKEIKRKSKKIKKLSPYGIWNIALLILRLEQEWTPETWEEFL